MAFVSRRVAVDGMTLPAATRTPARNALLLAAALLATTFAIYWPALRGEWLWDDNLDITENPLLRDTAGLAKIWFQPTTLDYYPLKFTVQWLQWQLWGANPLGYHVTNVLLHALSAFLLWRIFLRLGLRFAALGAFLFAVHPLAVQSVAWIAELKNALSLPPLLLALLAWLDFDERRSGGAVPSPRDNNAAPPRPTSAYARSLAWFIIAMLCKTAVVMFPLTLLLLTWWKHQRLTAADLRRVAPFLAVSLVLGLVTLHFHVDRSLAGETLAIGGPLARLTLVGSAFWFYLGKTLWPVTLLPVYPRWAIEPFAAWHLAPWLALGALLVACWRRRDTWGRHAVLGLGWFALHLAPALGLITISFMRFTWVMDHLTYVALPGLIGLIIAGLDALPRRRATLATISIPLVATSAILLGFLAILARAHAENFRNSHALWSHTLRHHPNAWVAHHNLGLARANAGDLPGAAAAYEAALRLHPSYFEPRMNLGNVRRQQGRLPEAIEHLEAAARLNPRTATVHYNLALAYLDTDRFPDALVCLDASLALKPTAHAFDARGDLHRRAGRAEDARRDYLAALALEPGHVEAQHHLAQLLASTDRPAEAIPLLTAALQRRPDYAEAHNTLAAVLVALHRTAEAVPHLERAVALRPDFVDGRFNLAVLLVRTGRPETAVPHFEHLLARDPSSLKLHYNLATALAASGRHADAVTHFRRALNLDSSYAQIHAHLAQSLLAIGQREAARDHNARARALDPTTPPLRPD